MYFKHQARVARGRKRASHAPRTAAATRPSPLTFNKKRQTRLTPNSAFPKMAALTATLLLPFIGVYIVESRNARIA